MRFSGFPYIQFSYSISAMMTPLTPSHLSRFSRGRISYSPAHLPVRLLDGDREIASPRTSGGFFEKPCREAAGLFLRNRKVVSSSVLRLCLILLSFSCFASPALRRRRRFGGREAARAAKGRPSKEKKAIYEKALARLECRLARIDRSGKIDSI
jgi:hypothetical protein